MIKSELKKTGIPILYYHSVADHDVNNEWSFLSIGVELFKKQINYLHRNGYTTCNWKELDDHLQGVKQLPEKTVMLHFDDGFLDNWSVVFPIMKKYNFKYSVLITPEFVQEGEIRPFVNETNEYNKDYWWGYLNNKEIKKMSDSNLVDFQAHGYTHTWYESSPRLIDIYNGNNFFPHISWNLKPQKKPYWLLDSFKPPLGYPIFEYKKSLELENRFILNEDCINELIASYDSSKTKEEILKSYNTIIKSYSDDGSIGEYETEKESYKRIMKELKSTREYIHDLTNKPVDYLVFPGGGSSKKILDFTKKFDYKLVSKGDDLNLFNSNVFQVERYSATYNNFPKNLSNFLNILFLKLQLKRAKGNFLVTKLFNLLR